MTIREYCFRKKNSRHFGNGLSRATAVLRIIDASRLWEEYLAKADAYVEEESFEVLYPSISEQWKVEPLTEPKRAPEPQGHTFFPSGRCMPERLRIGWSSCPRPSW